MGSSGKRRFKQFIVVGGSGQIGHRVIESALDSEILFNGAVITATTHEAHDGVPGGPAGDLVEDRVTSASHFKEAEARWHRLDLESSPETLKKELAALDSGLRAGAPTALVLAAAYTNVDGCETEPERCKRVNETNTTAVLAWAQLKYSAKIAFYSTDYVFDGEAGPYEERVKRNAVSHYGRSKAVIEDWLEKHAPDSIVIRTTGVFDYFPGSLNFLMQMLNLWGDGKRTRIPSDQFANPVWAGDVARATVDLLARDCSGVYNVAGGSQLPRTDFARAIASVFGLDAGLIDPVKTAELGQKARRPLKGGLTIDKVARELGWAPMDAVTALQFLKSRYLESGK